MENRLSFDEILEQVKKEKDIHSYDWYTIEVDSPGPSERNTNALECLLALCRAMGLKYKIIKLITRPGYGVAVQYPITWPTDFFVPRKREGVFMTQGKDPVEILRIAIDNAVSVLVKNASHNRSACGDF